MDYLKLLELEHRAAQLSLDLARLESSLHYGWVTMGAKENEEGEKKGGSKVFIEGGKITKGNSNLTGRSMKDGKLEKKTDSSAATSKSAKSPQGAKGFQGVDKLRRSQWKKDSSQMSNKELGEYHDQLRERKRNESDDNLRDEIDTEIQKVRELARHQTNQKVQKQIDSQSHSTNKPDAKDIRPTNTIKAYEKAKKQFPNQLLAMRVGDFYEFFGNDALEAAERYGLVITKRNGYPMSGFPANGYVTQLDSNVAIIDHTGKPLFGDAANKPDK